MRRKILFGIVFVLILLVVPVLFRSLTRPEPRSLDGAALSELTYDEVEFGNDSQDIELAGMTFVPEGEGPFPAVVFIHGSGDSRRSNKWYLTFVKHLQANGIAVLLPDKRGCESSGGDWRGASFNDLATDTHAAIQYLRETYPKRVSAIGVMGCSQGGQIVPIVASESDEVAFAINAVGSVVPFHDALVYEEKHNIEDMGVLPIISDMIARVSAYNIRKNIQPEFWDAIGNYDPLPYWAKVEVPALALFGDEDSNTPSQRSAERLDGLGKDNIRVRIFEGSGHPLEDPIGQGNAYVRREVLDELVGFILASS